MRRIRKGDNVVVITGKDKGKRGAVLRVLGDAYVLVEGANRVKKHQKPNPMKGTTGGIIDKEMPIHVSNVALWCNKCGATRIGYRIDDDGKKTRICRSCESEA
jgi:large subunit ribosomal protein L24